MPQRLLIFFILISVLIQGCSKKIASANSISGEISNKLAIQEIDFEYFHGKARLNYHDGKKERDVKTNIRIRKDSVIWMSFSIIGIQGGKALINHDSITVVSTVDKEYFVFDYKELSKRFNFKIDYNMVQAAFLGNLIQERAADDKVTHEATYDLLEQNNSTIYIKNYVNASLSKIERIELSNSDSKNLLTMSYTNFQEVEDRIFPFNGVISLFYKNAAGTLTNTITFEYTKAEVGDKELKFPFNIPRKYDRK